MGIGEIIKQNGTTDNDLKSQVKIYHKTMLIYFLNCKTAQGAEIQKFQNLVNKKQIPC